MSKDLLVEKHVIGEHHVFFKALDNATFLSKNLYNFLNYQIRQEYFEKERSGSTDKLKNLDIAFLYAFAKSTADYKALNSKVANGVLKQVISDWFNYFAALKAYYQDSSLFLGKPKPPKYKHKTQGRNLLTFEKGTISKKKKYTSNDLVYLTNLGLVIKSKVPFRLVRHVRIVVVNRIQYQIHVVYINNKRKENELDDSLFMGCDLGVDNLCTLTSNKAGFTPVIVNGRHVKSINQFYNKCKAEMQSKLPKDTKFSKAINRLGNKRRTRIEHLFHAISNFVIRLCLENNIGNFVIGKNVGWKQETSMGKENNQKFVSIPYEKLVHYLQYKCSNVGINLIITEESYTSKASFLDLDSIPDLKQLVPVEFSGYREHRGMYKRKGVTGNRARINADVNGSYNQIRKVSSKVFTPENVEALAVVPVRINVS